MAELTNREQSEMESETSRYVCHACIGDEVLAQQVANGGTQAELSNLAALACRCSKANHPLKGLSYSNAWPTMLVYWPLGVAVMVVACARYTPRGKPRKWK